MTLKMSTIAKARTIIPGKTITTIPAAKIKKSWLRRILEMYSEAMVINPLDFPWC